MRVTKILNADQEIVSRFLAVLGRGLIVASRSKTARPGFFIFAASFIREYLEPGYFQKERVLLKALEDCGFPTEVGPVGKMNAEHRRSHEISKALTEASKAWQGGDESGRAEVVWATSEYTDLMRHHFDQLKSLINPLLEQCITPDGELKIAEDLNRIEFADREVDPPDKYMKILRMLEDEVLEWEK